MRANSTNVRRGPYVRSSRIGDIDETPVCVHQGREFESPDYEICEKSEKIAALSGQVCIPKMAGDLEAKTCRIKCQWRTAEDVNKEKSGRASPKAGRTPVLSGSLLLCDQGTHKGRRDVETR